MSQNKKRYEKDGFNLDLVYLTSQIIVMGFPAVGCEQLYRNPRSQVVRFLETYHKNEFKLYNFCNEPNRTYDSSEFYGNVVEFPFEDHCVPTLPAIRGFCQDAMNWIRESKAHVVVLHCKAGKGRTGLMSCALLIESGLCQTAKEAIMYYNDHRVKDGRGLTVNSQKKWVGYFENYLKLNSKTLNVSRILTRIEVKSNVELPELWLHVYTLSTNAKEKELIHQVRGTDCFPLQLEIQGTVLLEFRKINACTGSSTRYMKCWINTLFLPQGKQCIPRHHLDLSVDKSATFKLHLAVG